MATFLKQTVKKKSKGGKTTHAKYIRSIKKKHTEEEKNTPHSKRTIYRHTS